MFIFLYKTYLLQMIFELVYIIRKKIFEFNDKFDILGFEKINKKLRLFIKYQDKVKNQIVSINCKELNVFFWLTFYFMYIYFWPSGLYFSIKKSLS